MYGEMRESGLTGIIPAICISAPWGQRSAVGFFSALVPGSPEGVADAAVGAWSLREGRYCFFLILHMDITRWSTPKSDWLYSLQPKMEKLYTVSKTRQGTDCGSDHELLIAKFRLKLKKVGKTTRPFRYDLNQISYDYRVEVRNRFKGLDLIERAPEKLWTEIREL